jgi:hypothetical protein
MKRREAPGLCARGLPAEGDASAVAGGPHVLLSCMDRTQVASSGFQGSDTPQRPDGTAKSNGGGRGATLGLAWLRCVASLQANHSWDLRYSALGLHGAAY